MDSEDADDRDLQSHDDEVQYHHHQEEGSHLHLVNERMLTQGALAEMLLLFIAKPPKRS